MRPKQERVLVTGATGFLGTRLVERLIEQGYRVRGLARRTSRMGRIEEAGAEVVFGDVADADSLRPAFQDIDVVVHAAADTKGTEDGTRRTTIEGTRNVVGLCRESGISKLVYISSLSVYGVADCQENEIITEETPLERFPEHRGFYSFGKAKAEEVIREAMEAGAFPIVCLRPGTIFGAGGDLFSPMIGFSAGTKVFAVIGMGGFVLPLVYLENLVDVIICAIQESEADGEIFNVVDAEPPTKKEYVEGVLKKVYPRAALVYVPYSLIYVGVRMQEGLMKLVGKRPILTRYRLVSSQKSVCYDSSKIERELGWQPPWSMEDAMKAVAAYVQKRR